MVMYKIDRRGGIQKSFNRTDPSVILAFLNGIFRAFKLQFVLFSNL